MYPLMRCINIFTYNWDVSEAVALGLRTSKDVNTQPPSRKWFISAATCGAVVLLMLFCALCHDVRKAFFRCAWQLITCKPCLRVVHSVCPCEEATHADRVRQPYVRPRSFAYVQEHSTTSALRQGARLHHYTVGDLKSFWPDLWALSSSV